MTDDAGYSDLSIYGAEFDTPNIDALAEAGLRFAKFYNNARCSPTRASLLTGRYPHAVGVGNLARVRDETPFPGYRGYLDPTVPTLAEVLRDAGYGTYMAGKWHLGGERKAQEGRGSRPDPAERSKWPLARGFDAFYGSLRGHVDYFSPRPHRDMFRDNEALDGPFEAGYYATDAVVDEALAMLEGHRQAEASPFFLYLAFHAPHDPLQAPPEATQSHEGTYDGGRAHKLAAARADHLRDAGQLPGDWHPSDEATWHLNDEAGQAAFGADNATVAAMMQSVDANVGRLVADLAAAGELDNTLILFLSDNGAAGLHSALGNWPFRGTKASLYEGGVATHGIVHWPDGVTRPGRIVRAEAHVIDVLPTVLEVTGASFPGSREGQPTTPPDGESFAGLLRGGGFERERPLHWDYEGIRATLFDGWKAVWPVEGEPGLYDLDDDPVEARNLADRHSHRLAQMRLWNEDWARANQVLPWSEVEAALRSKPERRPPDPPPPGD